MTIKQMLLSVVFIGCATSNAVAMEKQEKTEYNGKATVFNKGLDTQIGKNKQDTINQYVYEDMKNGTRKLHDIQVYMIDHNNNNVDLGTIENLSSAYADAMVFLIKKNMAVHCTNLPAINGNTIILRGTKTQDCEE